MTDRPILFSAPMVRALLDGRKTQTRRILKPQPLMGYTPDVTASKGIRFAKGDRLYVRERVWLPEGTDNPHGHVTYHADHGDDRALKWRPGIHMPRWASRLTLTVTDVRIERLQEISEEDAIAEGSREPSLVPIIGACWSERDAYAKLWEHINGPGGWGANPWVVALTFTVEQRNIDA